MSLNTYSGQILWMLLPLQKLKFTSYANFIELNNCLKTFAFYRGCELLFFTFVCLVSRYHLFVWTVFSPKLLYEGMQTAVLTSSVIFINLIQVLLHLKLKIE
jgi:ethanolaminephosphotransferase